MFELSVALKYLIPRKKQLSVSLIALLSVGVISLVVWLVLVFLSVTEGIEKNWLQKLTTLNAPLRITPTSQYFSSYYYQIDEISEQSQYTLKNIKEKADAPSSDPYNPSEDGQLPFRFPKPDLLADGSLKDPVKELFALLSQLKQTQTELVFQDFELSGALLRLQLLRPENGIQGNKTQGYLTQVSYLASLPDQCPGLSSLLLPPTEKDIHHLLYLASHATELARQDSPALTLKTQKEIARSRIEDILKNVSIKQLKPLYPLWQISFSLLPENQPFEAVTHFRGATLSRVEIPIHKDLAKSHVKIWKEGTSLFLQEPTGQKKQIPSSTPLLINGPIAFDVENFSSFHPLLFKVHALLQGCALKGEVSLDGLEIAKAHFIPSLNAKTPWINLADIHLQVNQEKETGVLLAKGFLENGVRIGDRGYLSYSSATASSIQEHRLPIFVSGFYDPGILSVGNKCILVPPFVTHAINSSNSSFNLDKTQSNGVLVWFNDLSQAEKIKNLIQLELNKQGLEQYW